VAVAEEADRAAVEAVQVVAVVALEVLLVPGVVLAAGSVV
jgi:hypothetical protein